MGSCSGRGCQIRRAIREVQEVDHWGIVAAIGQLHPSVRTFDKIHQLAKNSIFKLQLNAIHHSFQRDLEGVLVGLLAQKKDSIHEDDDEVHGE